MAETPPSIRTFDDFLAASIERLRESDDSASSLAAFLLAVPEAWRFAWEGATKDGYGKVAAAGSLSLATATALVKLAASGPLGFVLTGVSTGALVATLSGEWARVVERSRSITSVVERFRVEFAELASERSRRTMRESQWSVIMDGMVGRFASELSSSSTDPAAISGFAEHVVGASIRPPAPKAVGSR